MKNKLLILAGFFIFFQLGFSLRCFFPHYRIEGRTVKYTGRERLSVDKADVETFKDLDGVFGIDKNHVYYEGKILKNIDVKTFEITERYKVVADDPIWGIGCQTPYIIKFKDKNGEYKLEDISKFNN